MSKFDRLSLLKFLSKPRLVHEVAEHYGISKKLANFHLREVVKCGQVLVSKRPVLQKLRSSNVKIKRCGEFVYVFRNSPMLANGLAKFRVEDANSSASKSKGKVFSIRFLTKAHGSIGKEVLSRKLLGFPLEKRGGPRASVRHLKTRSPLTIEFDVSSAKVKMAKYKEVDQLLGRRPRPTREVVKSLSHAERIRLFQALLKEPLPFLELHGRFGVSKQTTRRLIKNGLLTETWGPKAIGVRLKLTNKGKIYLKEMEAAAKYEPKKRETAFIRLKHRTLL